MNNHPVFIQEGIYFGGQTYSQLLGSAVKRDRPKASVKELASDLHVLIIKRKDPGEPIVLEVIFSSSELHMCQPLL